MWIFPPTKRHRQTTVFRKKRKRHRWVRLGFDACRFFYLHQSRCLRDLILEACREQNGLGWILTPPGGGSVIIVFVRIRGLLPRLERQWILSHGFTCCFWDGRSVHCERGTVVIRWVEWFAAQLVGNHVAVCWDLSYNFSTCMLAASIHSMPIALCNPLFGLSNISQGVRSWDDML